MSIIHENKSCNISRIFLGLSILPLKDDSSPLLFWATMFMWWNILMNHDDLDSASHSSIITNSNILYWFIKSVTRTSNVTRGGLLLIDGNPKIYEVWSRVTHCNKYRGHSMDILKIEEVDIHFKHESKGKIR